MRRHTLIGERILAAAPALAPASPRSCAPATSAGTARGYPDGLAGEEIPLGARIIAVCDAFDAMTADRPYRDRDAAEAALERAAALRRRAVRPGGRAGLRGGAHRGARSAPPWPPDRARYRRPMADPDAANLFTSDWDAERGGVGVARVGRRAGSRHLGASVYELAPHSKAGELHAHHANEELIAVLSGTPTLRTPG